MKKNIFLAFTVLILASCSKEKRDAPVFVAYDAAKISLSFVTAAADSKAVGDAPSDDDKKINNYMAFIFRADGEFDKREMTEGVTTDGTVYSGTGDGRSLDVTTAAHEVYIIGNLGSESNYNTILGGITNKSDLLGLVKVMREFNSITTGNVLYIGTPNAPVQWGALSATNNEGKIKVKMVFPLAKIKLIVADKRIGNADDGSGDVQGVPDATNPTSSRATNIVILNAGQRIQFFGDGAEKATQNAFYSGIMGYGEELPIYNSEVSKNDRTVLWLENANESDADNVSHHFYTAANDGEAVGRDGKKKPTILAIQTSLIKWDEVKGEPSAAVLSYFPIQFTLTDAKYTLEAGKSYTVRITLNGDLSKEEGEGTPNPDDEVIAGDGANMEVLVTAGKWEGQDTGDVEYDGDDDNNMYISDKL